MKINRLLFLFFLATAMSCQGPQLSHQLGCSEVDFNNLETLIDVRENFSVQLPKHWNTNLYYDQSQSSIYAADTTKQLTDSYLIDITMITGQLNFDKNFLVEYRNNLLKKGLVESSSLELPLWGKPAYFSRVLGNKRGYPYQLANLFIAVDEQQYLHAKTEVYGDSLANERMCEAIQLIQKINFQND